MARIMDARLPDALLKSVVGLLPVEPLPVHGATADCTCGRAAGDLVCPDGGLSLEGHAGRDEFLGSDRSHEIETLTAGRSVAMQAAAMTAWRFAGNVTWSRLTPDIPECRPTQ